MKIVTYIVTALLINFTAVSSDNLSNLDLQSKFIALKKIRIVLPVKHYIQKNRIFTNKEKIIKTQPHCYFIPHRGVSHILPGDIAEVVKFKGRVSRFKLKRPFIYKFIFNEVDQLSELECRNSINSTKELTVTQFKNIFNKLFSFEPVFQDRSTPNPTEPKMIDLKKNNYFIFYTKFGFFENRMLYFQEGELYKSPADLSPGSYCYLTSSTDHMVIHPKDQSRIKRIKGGFSLGEPFSPGFRSTIELKDLDLKIVCLEERSNKKTTVEYFKFHFGKYLTLK